MERKAAHMERNKGMKDVFWQDWEKATVCQWTYDFDKHKVGQCSALALWVEVQPFISARWGSGRGTKWVQCTGKHFSHLISPHLFSLSPLSPLLSSPPLSYFLSFPSLSFPLLLYHPLASSLLCFYILLSFPCLSSLCLQSANTGDLVKQLEEGRSREVAGWQRLSVIIITLDTGDWLNGHLYCSVKSR